MNAKTIETLSINAVSDSIEISELLSQYISENDKEPSWDGAIYIYNHKSKKKDKIDGRVPVQVKGKICNDLSRSEISFPIDVVDMKNYLYNGGAIYFVVYISKDGIEKKIYYTSLLPVKLKSYIFQAKEQKTKTVKLKEFPKENSRKATILLNFLKDSRKQASFAAVDILSLGDLENMSELEGLSFSVSGYGYDNTIVDRQKAFFENEIYLYASIKGSNIPHPIDVIPERLMIKEKVPSKISIGGKQYYNEFSRIRSLGTTTIRIGGSLSIIYNQNKDTLRFDYKNSPMLRVRAKDLGFLINTIHAKGFYFHNEKFPFDPIEYEAKQFNIVEEEKSLEYYLKMISVLETLNVTDDINLEELTDKERSYFHSLIIAFIDKKPVKSFNSNLPLTGYVDIGNINLLLMFKKHGDTEDYYDIFDFLSSEMVVYYEDDNRNKLRISLYSVLKKEGYMKTSNIDYDEILPSYQSLESENKYIGEIANQDMLEMLLAYDEAQTKNIKLFRAIKSIAKWVLNNEEIDIPQELKTLNYLQVIRREREFTKQEKFQLFTIIQDRSMGEDVLTATHLLLGNQEMAEMHFEKIDNELQENFRKFPIYKFWNKNGE